MSSLLESIMDGIPAKAEQNLRKDGHLMPCLFLNVEGKIQIVGIAANDKPVGETVREIVLPLIQEGRLREFIMLAESWVTLMDEAETRRFLRGQGRPDRPRQSAITIMYSSPAKQYGLMGMINDSTKAVTWDDKPMSQASTLVSLGLASCSHLWQEGKAGEN